MVITKKEHDADDVSLLDYEQQQTEPEVPAVLDDEDIMRLLVELVEVATNIYKVNIFRNDEGNKMNDVHSYMKKINCGNGMNKTYFVIMSPFNCIPFLNYLFLLHID